MTKQILIIGGTRNLGHFMVHDLLERGHRVTVLNRGITRDELPNDVERLQADRTIPSQLAHALKDRNFDVVIDNALYKKPEAEEIVNILGNHVGHYIVLSSGQVYLVREGIERPFAESDYPGRIMPAPKPNTFGYEEWLYGVDKRAVEDVLMQAWQTSKFPVTVLRLPMVNSERDHFNRLLAYILRLEDGSPILAPSTPNYALRHVYGGDVVAVISHLVHTAKGKGEAINVSQEETLSLEAFLDTLAGVLGVDSGSHNLVRVRRDLLEANGFLPDCSPFSERWMSELDNTYSKQLLGFAYTPLETYLHKIVTHYRENPISSPSGYKRRRAELLLKEQIEEGLVSAN
jgi:nucleoside-diphosphate-sugar epimerase